MNKSGFTIVELLVSTGIVVVLLSLVIANFRLGNQKDELRIKGLQVMSDLRQTQNDALSAVALADGTIPRGYGVHFDDNTNYYVLFAKTGGTDWLYSTGNKADVKKVSLGNSVIIPSGGMNDPEDPIPTCHHVEPGVMDIIFTVPEAEIFVNGLQPNNTDCGAYNPSWVELYHRVSGHSLRVETNWISGQISVSNIN